MPKDQIKKCSDDKSQLPAFDEKKQFTKYGVSVDKKFIDAILNNEYLTMDHIKFFSELFLSMYPQSKILNFSSQFFLDFMPQLREQNPTPLCQQPTQQNNNLEKQLINQQNSQSQKLQDVQENQFDSDNKIKQKDNQIESIKQVDQKASVDQEKKTQGDNKKESSKTKIEQKQSDSKRQENKDLTNKQVVNEGKQKVNQQVEVSQNIKVELEQKQYQWEIVGKYLKEKSQQLKVEQQELGSQFEYFFFPIFIGKHCLSAIISKKNKCLIFCDSMVRAQDETITQGLICLALRNLQVQSPLKVYEAAPKQKNDYDCGVFVLLSLLSVVRQNYVYDQEEVDKFRKYRLYKLAIESCQRDLQYSEFETLLKE